MSEQDKTKQNKNTDLDELRSLIGDADRGDFSLDDILDEYSTRRSAQRTAVPTQADLGPDLLIPPEKQGRRTPPPHRDNVVPFPGQPEEESADFEADEEELPPPPPEGPAEEDGDDGVIPFPEEETILGSFLKNLSRKADQYADEMFLEDERTDPEEVRRLEELIPGTDREEAPPLQTEPRRPKKQKPPPPDVDPQRLAKAYGKGLTALHVRVVLLALLCIPAVVQLVIPALGYPWLPPLDRFPLQAWISAGLLAAGMALSYDLLFRGLCQALRGRVGMDSMLVFAAAATLADALLLSVRMDREGQLPCTAVVLCAMLFQLEGYHHKRRGQRLACRTAASASEPYRLTLDEAKWNGKRTYTKEYGAPTGFGSQIQEEDGAQRIFHRVCPLLLLGCVLLSLLASVGQGRPERLVWALSSTLSACSAFGAGLVFGRPFHMLSRRLALEGAALAGWPGIARSGRDTRVVITDPDLFPPGYVSLNGFKVMGNFPMERVISITATLIRDSGSGLTRPFHDLMRTQGGIYRNAEGLCCYEGGGLSATVRGDQVLVGSAAFMKLMEIPLPPGLNVKSAVFCAIEGELAGIFALNYELPDTCLPALDMLMREKVGPVLATRDFNLIPAMLRQRFKLAADRMDFPPVERRRELSAPQQEHSEVLTALLCREGLLPYAESIVAARRLRRTTRLGTGVCCLSSVLGLVITAYLTAVEAFGSLSPLNLLAYMLIWLLPVWLLTSGTDRY